MAEIRARLAFLRDVGLGYLALDRAAPTLSGGEAQRIRLAAQLGSNLRGVCYVLDEPTIGLHPRDNAVLLDTLEQLGDKGNTLLVVEHDEDTIRRADHVIDLGPGAGSRGGRVVGQGRVEDLIAAPESITGRFLANPLRHPLRRDAPFARATQRSWIERDAAQPARRRRRVCRSAGSRRDRRVRARQVDARARRAVREPARALVCAPSARARCRDCVGCKASRAGRRSSACSRSTRRRSARRRVRARDLRRLLGRHPQAVRRRDRGARARLQRRAASRSIRPAAAAKPAKGRACRRSR